jgi:hypothetical protein
MFLNPEPTDQNKGPTINKIREILIKKKLIKQEKEDLKTNQENKKPEERDKIIIFDDLAHEMKHPKIGEIIRLRRHIKANIICSVQQKIDIPPAVSAMADYIMFFGGIPYDKIVKLWNDLSVGMTFQDFHDLYEEITAKKHAFMMFDRVENQIRKNLNELLVQL